MARIQTRYWPQYVGNQNLHQRLVELVVGVANKLLYLRHSAHADQIGATQTRFNVAIAEVQGEAWHLEMGQEGLRLGLMGLCGVWGCGRVAELFGGRVFRV